MPAPEESFARCTATSASAATFGLTAGRSRPRPAVSKESQRVDHNPVCRRRLVVGHRDGSRPRPADPAHAGAAIVRRNLGRLPGGAARRLRAVACLRDRARERGAIVPNTVAFVVCSATIAIALRFRRPAYGQRAFERRVVRRTTVASDGLPRMPGRTETGTLGLSRQRSKAMASRFESRRALTLAAGLAPRPRLPQVPAHAAPMTWGATREEVSAEPPSPGTS